MSGSVSELLEQLLNKERELERIGADQSELEKKSKKLSEAIELIRKRLRSTCPHSIAEHVEGRVHKKLHEYPRYGTSSGPPEEYATIERPVRICKVCGLMEYGKHHQSDAEIDRRLWDGDIAEKGCIDEEYTFSKLNNSADREVVPSQGWIYHPIHGLRKYSTEDILRILG